MNQLQTALVVASALILAPLSCQMASIRSPKTEPVREAESLTDLAHRAVLDTEVSEDAIRKLREHERAGLEALFSTHSDAVARLSRDPSAARSESSLQRLRHAIDRVAGQRDAHLSELYWHTDLERAKEEARATSRPILSLRMLGRLDEELSCANSRMFRTLLYPHARVRDLLAKSFVLHWSSERPVPQIAIDMGDGRELRSTITGNSVHYVLDAAGNPIDAIPGLHGATSFVEHLEAAREAASTCKLAEDHTECVRDWHIDRSQALARDYAAELATLSDELHEGMPRSLAELRVPRSERGLVRELEAFDAGALALGKGAIELPMLERMRAVRAPSFQAPVAWWTYLTRVESRDFDQRVERAMALKMDGPDPSGSVRAQLSLTVAADSVRNRYVLHEQIHRMFVDDRQVLTSFVALNRRVYAEVFLTPKEDPWLGLRDDAIYDALEG